MEKKALFISPIDLRVEYMIGKCKYIPPKHKKYFIDKLRNIVFSFAKKGYDIHQMEISFPTDLKDSTVSVKILHVKSAYFQDTGDNQFLIDTMLPRNKKPSMNSPDTMMVGHFKNYISLVQQISSQDSGSSELTIVFKGDVFYNSSSFNRQLGDIISNRQVNHFDMIGKSRLILLHNMTSLMEEYIKQVPGIIPLKD